MRVALFWVLGLSGVAWAQEVPSHLVMRDVPVQVGSIELGSGTRLYLEEERSRPLAVVVVTMDVGSSADPAGQEGLAHLVEHLAFRSRVADDPHSLTEKLEIVGAGRWNAVTRPDLTTFYAEGSSSTLRVLARTVLTHLTDPLAGIDQATFEAEKQVVRNELLERDELGLITGMATALMGALYPPEHPYSRPGIGTVSSLAALTLDQARALASAHYRPANMTVVLGGDVDLSRQKELLEAVIPPVMRVTASPSELPHLPRVDSAASPPPELPPGPAVRRVRARVDLPTLTIGWSLPRGFGAAGNMQQLLEDLVAFVAPPYDEDVIGIGTYLQQGKLGSTLILTLVLAEGKNPERTTELVLDQIAYLWRAETGSNNRALRKVFAEEHLLTQWRTFSTVEQALQFESLVDRNVRRAEFAHLLGDPDLFGRQRQDIVDVTWSQMAHFAERWVNRSRARAVFVEPEGGAPAVGRDSAVFGSVSNLRLSVPDDALRKATAPGGAQLRSFQLPSGLDVVVARRPSSPVVAVTLAARGGEADSRPAGAGSLAKFASVRQWANGRPANYGIRRNRSIEWGSSYVQFEAASGNLENALGMLREAVGSQDLSINPVSVKALLPGASAVFNLPSERAERDVLASVYRGTALERVASPEEYLALSSGAANDWLERTWKPSNTVLSVAGDIDLDVAESAIHRWFDRWTSDGKSRASPPVLSDSAAISPVPVIRTPRQGAQQTVLTIACATPLGSIADLAALQVLAERATTKLNQMARLALGASYGFHQSVKLISGVGQAEVQGAVDDRALPRLVALARSQAGALGQLPPPDELSRFVWREGIRSGLRLEGSRVLGRALADLRLAGLPADGYERYPEALAQLKAEDVARIGSACRRTVTIGLLGDPTTLDRASRATGQ
jgi:zinc protease